MGRPALCSTRTTRLGWEIGERGATMLILFKGDARLSISATSAGRIIDVLTP